MLRKAAVLLAHLQRDFQKLPCLVVNIFTVVEIFPVPSSTSNFSSLSPWHLKQIPWPCHRYLIHTHPPPTEMPTAALTPISSLTLSLLCFSIQGPSCYHKEQSFASFIQGSALTYCYPCHFCSLITLRSHVYLLGLYYDYISQSFASLPLSDLIYFSWITSPKFISLSFHRMNLKAAFWLHLKLL